jgi:hypothetical protein
VFVNQRKIDRVAEAICREAGKNGGPRCRVCDDPEVIEPECLGKCRMVVNFRDEAVAAIKAMKGF